MAPTKACLRRLLAGCLAILATAVPGAGPAASSGRGPQVVAYTVDGAAHEGVLFVPDKLGPKPLVLLFDPNGDAKTAVGTWAVAAGRAGWMVASTSHVRNGTADAKDAREMLALLEALKGQHQIDTSRIYTAGVSGGGCGAYLLALTRSEVFAGSFVQVAHMGSWREHGLASKIRRTDQSYYLFTRTSDFNRPAMQQLATVLRGAGLGVTLVERPGGHQGMAADEVAVALEWMQGRQTRR